MEPLQPKQKSAAEIRRERLFNPIDNFEKDHRIWLNNYLKNYSEAIRDLIKKFDSEGAVPNERLQDLVGKYDVCKCYLSDCMECCDIIGTFSPVKEQLMKKHNLIIGQEIVVALTEKGLEFRDIT